MNTLAPSKSTVYVSNLPFALTNNDLHKIFQEFGKVVKVTIVRDRKWRTSKGIAFILYLERDEALKCVKEMNNKEMFGRTLKCSIARDNGRASEFIRKREYHDKSSCYECGNEGHLSYACPSNKLGERQPPPKKQRIRKKTNGGTFGSECESDNDETNYESNEFEDLETLSSAIKMEQIKNDSEFKYDSKESEIASSKKRIKKNPYFSDEEISD